MENTNLTKSSDYYLEIAQRMEMARGLSAEPPEHYGRFELWSSQKTKRQRLLELTNSLDKKPLSDDERKRLEAAPQEPIADQIDAVLWRDKILADMFLAKETARLQLDLDPKEVLRAALLKDAPARRTEAAKQAEASKKAIFERYIQWKQQQPRHNLFTWIGALFYVNRRQEEILAYIKRWQTWIKNEADPALQVTIPGAHQRTLLALHKDIELANGEVADIKTQLQQLPDQVNTWLAAGQKWASELKIGALQIDANVAFADTRSRLLKGQPVLEAEWEAYELSNIIVAEVVGFEAARSFGPVEARHDVAIRYRFQFEDLVGKQLPDDIWELMLAKARFKKAASSVSNPPSGGRGGRERDMHADWLAAAKERAKELAKQELERKKQEEKERLKELSETLRRTWEQLQFQLLIQQFFTEELNRASTEYEKRAPAAPSRDMSHGRDRGGYSR